MDCYFCEHKENDINLTRIELGYGLAVYACRACKNSILKDAAMHEFNERIRNKVMKE